MNQCTAAARLPTSPAIEAACHLEAVMVSGSVVTTRQHCQTCACFVYYTALYTPAR